VEAIRRGPDPLAAIQFAYDLLRSHYSAPEAHRAFLCSMSPGPNRAELPPSPAAGPGVAVQYSEPGRPSSWIVIEDCEPIHQELNEVGLSSHLAKRLDGKKVGETFQISEHRPAKVEGLLSKFVYRYQRVLSDWETTFPDEFGVKQIPLTTDPSGRADLTEILRVLDQQEKDHQRIENIFRQGSMPIAMFANGMVETRLKPKFISQIAGRSRYAAVSVLPRSAAKRSTHSVPQVG